jgi:hypothetical protein
MCDSLKNQLYAIISGKIEVRNGKTIQTIASYLRTSKEASIEFKESKHFKEEERKRLEIFIDQNLLWLDFIDLDAYVSEGAEQKVYLNNQTTVLKLNDSIYYAKWLDYFHNLLLHNFFFEDTAYKLIGFYKLDNVLFAVVQQPYVLVNSVTNLNNVKTFLKINGFVNTRNNDYYNSELGIILEDLHDENVLTKDGLLYFIDTVFYLTPDFWKDFVS